MANQPLERYESAMADRPLRVHIFALRDCAPFVPVGLFDLLRKSIELAATMPSRRARRRIELAIVSGDDSIDVVSANGLVIRADRTIGKAGPCDLAIIPALDPDVVMRLEQNRDVV